MKELFKELCESRGVSGDEQNVRSVIEQNITGFCESYTDKVGNLICFKRGKQQGKSLMVCAHMDEVGFIVTYINDDGTLCFGAVGGVDPCVVIGRQVRVGKNLIYGVVSSPAVHNLSAQQRESSPKFDDLCIDIGADSKEEAEKHVSLGDCVYFQSDFTQLGERRVKSKAIDDRAGCAVMVELMKQELEYDTFFVFTVREEIGLRGAGVATHAIKPDFAIVLEATTAGDIEGVTGHRRVCELGKGPVVGFMDRSTMYDRELYNLAFETARENNIPCQTKTMIAGGNDAGIIHTTGTGVRTIAVSVPCRYLHSASCLIDYSDFENVYRLTKLLIKRIPEL